MQLFGASGEGAGDTMTRNQRSSSLRRSPRLRPFAVSAAPFHVIERKRASPQAASDISGGVAPVHEKDHPKRRFEVAVGVAPNQLGW